MQKVKVTRYVSGRRPEYAPDESPGESSDEEEGGFVVGGEGGREGEGEGEGGELRGVELEMKEEDWIDDPRLRRLRERRAGGDSGRYDVNDSKLSCNHTHTHTYTHMHTLFGI